MNILHLNHVLFLKTNRQEQNRNKFKILQPMSLRNLSALFFSIVMLAQSGCDADNRNEGKNREIDTIPADTIIHPIPEEKKTVTQDDIVLKKIYNMINIHWRMNILIRTRFANFNGRRSKRK